MHKTILKPSIKLAITSILLLAFSTTSQAEVPTANSLGLQKITGFKMPESVLQAKDGTIYISEIGEFGKDGDGQISKIDANGKVSVFATGMDDPKGIALVGDKLYVADKVRVLEVSKDGTWSVYGAQMAFPSTPQFLNDLIADKYGNLYVSDSGNTKAGGQIFKIAKNGLVTIVVDSKNPDILAPNGLLLDGHKNLLEVDFESGILYRVQLKTGKTTKIAEGFGGGDGLVRTKTGDIYVSDYKGGKVYHIQNGKAVLIKEGYKTAADIELSYDGKTLMVPDMNAGELDFIGIK